MKLLKYFVFATVLMLINCSFISTPNVSEGIQIISKVFTRKKDIHGLKVTMFMAERIKNEYVKKKADFKIKYNPLSIYLKQEYPMLGLEVLYVKGTNFDKALVNTNSFPWTTFNFDPLGLTMRKGQHHSIFKAGFDFFIDVLEHLSNKYKDQLNERLVYNGLVKYGDRICYKITVNNPDFKYVNYTVQEGDNLELLSQKFKVCDFMIYERNESVHSFETLKAGSVISVPNDYGKQFILYFDTELLIPVGVKIYDEVGLFEEYSYLNIELNPNFQADEFSRKYKAYGFD